MAGRPKKSSIESLRQKVDKAAEDVESKKAALSNAKKALNEAKAELAAAEEAAREEVQRENASRLNDIGIDLGNLSADQMELVLAALTGVAEEIAVEEKGPGVEEAGIAEELDSTENAAADYRVEGGAGQGYTSPATDPGSGIHHNGWN